ELAGARRTGVGRLGTAHGPALARGGCGLAGADAAPQRLPRTARAGQRHARGSVAVDGAPPPVPTAPRAVPGPAAPGGALPARVRPVPRVRPVARGRPGDGTAGR